ncbi:MAG: tail fiber protein, partial [Magnetospirillum sp.]|nr:tail fiber protein [Magnetospirillum sp.]
MDCYVGEIRLFAGSYAPVGWHLCDGTILTIKDYEILFSTLGTIWGGNGTTTFALPDLRG